MEGMLSQKSPASSFGRNSAPRRFQPPLRLRAVDRGGRPLGVMCEDHELYALAASLYLAQPDLGRLPQGDDLSAIRRAGRLREDRFLLETYTHLARNWPTERKRGPRPPRSAHLAWRNVESVARGLVITRKAAAARVRAASQQQTRLIHDWVRQDPPERGPWVAGAPEHERIYVASKKEAMFELDIDDPNLILAEPDLELLSAREIATGARQNDDASAWWWRIPAEPQGTAWSEHLQREMSR